MTRLERAPFTSENPAGDPEKYRQDNVIGGRWHRPASRAAQSVLSSRSMLGRVFSATILACVCLLAALAAFKLFDLYLMASVPAPPTADEESAETTMRSFEIYPYTGGQMQPYMRERGELLWSKAYKDFDIVSGEYGFFIDHPLEAWPKKAPKEIRIILTGGSTAQGWGGRTNADMFYKLLPARMTESLAGRCTVTVVNLAMGGSMIYQNFIALNKWAHDLDPDAIISFSGHNEIALPWLSRSDDNGTDRAAAAERVFRHSASPEWLKQLGDWFPGLVKRTKLGAAIRLSYFDQYRREWTAAYVVSRLAPHEKPMTAAEEMAVWRRIHDGMTIDDAMRKLSAPLYLHGLKSIGRDFADLPVFAIFQPLSQDPDFYKLLRKLVVAGLSDRFQVLDLAAKWGAEGMHPDAFVDTVHFSNEGHIRVANELAAHLLPWSEKTCAKATVE